MRGSHTAAAGASPCTPTTTAAEQAAEGLASALGQLGQLGLQLARAMLLAITAPLGLFHLHSAAFAQGSGNTAGVLMC
jgi:hypothetical protein